jgi:hypothetical protein
VVYGLGVKELILSGTLWVKGGRRGFYVNFSPRRDYKLFCVFALSYPKNDFEIHRQKIYF